MGDGWRVGLSIERIDNDGDYRKSNCKWASRTEQAQNTRKSLMINLHGERINLAEACRRHGAIYNTMRHRIFKQRMTPEQAFGGAYNATHPALHGKNY